MSCFPDDVNGRVLHDMQASGADMSAEYDIDFVHVFAHLIDAEIFAQQSARYGRTDLDEYDGASSYHWQVTVVVRMVPTHAGVTLVEQELDALAGACGGRADGWGVLHGP